MERVHDRFKGVGKFYMRNASSEEEAIEMIYSDLATFSRGLTCKDHVVFEVAPFGPDLFPMDYLQRDFNVAARVFSATDPRKGCVGVMLAWKSLSSKLGGEPVDGMSELQIEEGSTDDES